MLVADLLCGAGGSSTGASRALADLGLKMELVCVNHWGVAIETHKRNHPEARHYVQDIATVRPHQIVPEGYLDLLMASPTCTHHSVARGGKPTSDQQRSDPWHIITWLTELRVRRIIIENVWEFIGWGPVDPRTGKPIKSRKGEYFRAWINVIRGLGFEPEWRKLNAADFGDATTRQRFILMARSDGKSVSWPVPTHRKREDGVLELLPAVKPWKPARDIIDWDIKGKSIFGRKKPLAPKTLARIYAGAVKFKWPEPFLVILRNHMAGQSVDQPLPTIAANGTHIGLAEPIVMANRNNNAAKSAGQPAPVFTTAPGGGVAVVEPIILNRHGDNGGGVRAHSVDDPMPTAVDRGAGYLIEPLVLSQHNSGAARSAEEPLPTITRGGAAAVDHPDCARPMLAEPVIVKQNFRRDVQGADQPLPTIMTEARIGLVEPFVLSQGAGGVPRAVKSPLPTMPTKGAHALVAPYYSSGSGETCKTAEEPLDTVTAKARFGMVVPVSHGGDGHRARDAGEPLPTVTGANRGELAFITAQHGEREGQAPRVHDVDAPAPTIAATGHIDLVEATQEYDILFRMLEPHELAAAMGFTGDDVTYEFAGTKTEQIKQIGNAVSVAKMKACVGAIMADAAPKTTNAPAKSVDARSAA
jgi:DNA (cytosine-5)-methyltransferase 1